MMMVIDRSPNWCVRDQMTINRSVESNILHIIYARPNMDIC